VEIDFEKEILMIEGRGVLLWRKKWKSWPHGFCVACLSNNLKRFSPFETKADMKADMKAATTQKPKKPKGKKSFGNLNVGKRLIDRE